MANATKTYKPAWNAVIERRRQFVARLWLRCLSMREIVAALGQEGPSQFLNPRTGKTWSIQTIHADIQTIKQRWRDSANEDVGEKIAAQDAHLDAVIRQAWTDADLNVILRALKQRAELFGLDAPKKVAPTDPSGEKPYIFSIDIGDLGNGDSD